MIEKFDPITPGEILLEEYLKPLGLTQNQLACALDVPVKRINSIVRNRPSITRDMAVRLAIYFRTSPDLWMNLQAQYDAKIARNSCL
jgi:addiction module HigA family antidote